MVNCSTSLYHLGKPHLHNAHHNAHMKYIAVKIQQNVGTFM